MSEADPHLTPTGDEADPHAIEAFIARWEKSGGSEMANFQTFANELCDLLGVKRPEPSQAENELNDYVFERRVDFKFDDGSTSLGRIDLYKRDCFVMEAKQSAKRLRARKADPRQPDLLPEDATQVRSGPATRGTYGWDRVMHAAKRQAEDYARALPKEHGWPPFVLVVDVGHVIEVYADFSGQGKNYAQFPDRPGYSIPLEGLRDPEIRARLRKIWTEPRSLDPAAYSAEVTRDIAARLAGIARNLEDKYDPRVVAEFLMRCLFTMFAEDVGLLPEKGFEKLLGDMVESPKHFPPALESLWKVMDEGGYAPHLNETIKRFNGTLFRNRRALALDKDDIRELWIASRRDWRDVEPAIFGTLLERALDERERAKLGAHYTPRAYVERLVIPTIIEPLRADWEEALAHVHEQEAGGDRKGALRTIKDFHHQLCTTRVLDPACGTGNFLYVSLELMKRLEGEVLEALDDLGEDAPRFTMEGETVGPDQFYGLEINPRAVPIADLVLWIGYLKWQLRTISADRIPEPVLHAYGTIQEQDAILAYKKRELLRDEKGKPLTRWDGFTTKLHPVTSEEIPDPEARVEQYRYENPRAAAWPLTEFIIGNPPFIGGGIFRQQLGDGYANAIWTVRPKLPRKADIVMHFWDQASEIAQRDGSVLRRFGFITTNTINQSFSRRVVKKNLSAKRRISLVYAIADHPWTNAPGTASVRIAMTVGEVGNSAGVLGVVTAEENLESDSPSVQLSQSRGDIGPSIVIGTDPSESSALLSNSYISSNGMMLAGAPFIVNMRTKNRLTKSGSDSREIRPYVNGKDLTSRIEEKFVIDMFGKRIIEIQEGFPEIYNYLLQHIKPLRDHNNRESFRNRWWTFGEPRKLLRDFSRDLRRFIVTTETTKHRFFQFLDAQCVPDHMIVTVGLSHGRFLAILSSRIHWIWVKATAASLGVYKGPARYSKSRTLDPFPFPDLSDICAAQLVALDELGERLDSFRKHRLDQYDFLTMTSLYNLLERDRELENRSDVPPLSETERDIHEAGLVSALKEIHDDIDRAVFEVYGWADLIPELVGKPGATMPSPYKTQEQEEAEEELLSRLVTLNRERAEEEQRGIVRWLRPEYQIPKLGHKAKQPHEAEQIEADLAAPEPADGKPAWPRDELARIRVVRDMLARAAAPLAVEDLSAAFRGRRPAGRMKGVEKALQTLVAAGVARQEIDERDGGGRYFIPR